MRVSRIVRKRFWAKVEKTSTCWIWTGERNPSGYGVYRLKRNTKQFRTHRLVWMFTHNVVLTSKQCVLHKCDNPPCVRLGHLFRGTHQDNNADRDAKGRTAYGEHIGSSVLTEDDVWYIVLLMQNRFTPAWIAEHLGVHKSTVYSVWSGQQWSHVTGRTYSPGGISGRGRTLSEGQARSIVRWYAEGSTRKQIATRLGVQYVFVQRVLSGESWSAATGIQWVPYQNKAERHKAILNSSTMLF